MSRSSGSPPTLWWLLIVAAVAEPDSITSGYSVPCTRKRASAACSRAASSNTRMNCSPMILRLRSGSSTPRSAPRKRSRASTATSRAEECRPNASTTCSASPARSSPWSTNTQTSRSPTASCTSAAATAESTPPDSPHSARPSPTCARTAATDSSMTECAVQVRGSPAASRKADRTCTPAGVWLTSGWYCTPNSRRSTSSKAATGELAVDAVTRKPGGGFTTASRCDIHTVWALGWSRSSELSGSADRSVAPYSAIPLGSTSPPSTEAMSCWP